MKGLLVTIILVCIVLIQIFGEVPVRQWIQRNKDQEQ